MIPCSRAQQTFVLSAPRKSPDGPPSCPSLQRDHVCPYPGPGTHRDRTERTSRQDGKSCNSRFYKTSTILRHPMVPPTRLCFPGNPLTLCTPTPPPTQIDVQTKASLARLSAGLATFIYKMIHDCGNTQARLHRHDRTESNLCRHCSSAPETPSHLWECLGPSSTTTFQQFTDSPSGERAREWLLSLHRHGVTI